jgi:hypothetical protein
MLALSLESAKTIGIVLAVTLGIFAIGSAWVIKTITTKLITVVVLGGLAWGIYTQRAYLTDCADRAKKRLKAASTEEITCTFFGSEVPIDLDGGR